MIMHHHQADRGRCGADMGARAAGAVLLAVLAVAAGCKSATPPGRPKPRNVSIEVIKLIPQLFDTIKLPGKTEPNRLVRVMSEVAGRIEQVATTEGQIVLGSDTSPDGASLIVTLNTDILQATYDRYEAEADFNKLEYDRLGELYERNVATRHEWDQARARYLIARALQETAAANLQRCCIYAPIGGVLNRLPVEQGEYLQPGMLVAEIVDVDQIKVVVDVPERDVSYLSIGAQAAVIARQRGRDEEFAGAITYISRLADPDTFTSCIEITVDNTDGRLRTGQIVDVFLTRRVIADAIMIPLDAVIPRQHDRVVYIISPQAELALDVPKIVAGLLAEGDEVIWRSSLEQGDAARQTAEIARIEPHDADGNTVRLYLRIDMPHARLEPGTVIAIELPGRQTIEAAIEPVTSAEIAPPEGDQADMTVARLLLFAERRIVELGIIRGNRVRVVAGLEAGDMLIVSGQQYVGPRQAVRIVPSVEQLAAPSDGAPDTPTDRQQQ